MTGAERNKAIVRRLYEETDKGNIAIIDELFAEDLVNHQSGVTPVSAGTAPIENLKAVFRLFRKGFPDTEHVIEEMIAEGDKVAARVSASGRHTGEMLGVKPTGKRFTMSGMVAYRFRNGRIVERWAEEDRLGFYQQLGLVTLPGAAHYR